MRRLLRRLIVIASVTGLVMALNVGVAWADHGLNPNSPFGTMPGEAVSPSPVGSHLVSGDAPGHPGADNGFGRLHDGDDEFGPGLDGVDFDNPAIIGLTHNPNCPFHYLS